MTKHTTKKIHLDLDGVIVDLETIVFERTGCRWGELPADVIWAMIREKAPDLFVEAKPLPDAHILVKEVLAFAAERKIAVEILTAVPRLASFPHAATQKQTWLKTYFPKLAALPFKIGPHSKDKQKHATPGAVLIDDNHFNIEQWAAAGGIAISHTDAASSLAALKKLVP